MIRLLSHRCHKACATRLTDSAWTERHDSANGRGQPEPT